MNSRIVNLAGPPNYLLLEYLRQAKLKDTKSEEEAELNFTSKYFRV